MKEKNGSNKGRKQIPVLAIGFLLSLMLLSATLAQMPSVPAHAKRPLFKPLLPRVVVLAQGVAIGDDGIHYSTLRAIRKFEVPEDKRDEVRNTIKEKIGEIKELRRSGANMDYREIFDEMRSELTELGVKVKLVGRLRIGEEAYTVEGILPDVMPEEGPTVNLKVLNEEKEEIGSLTLVFLEKEGFRVVEGEISLENGEKYELKMLRTPRRIPMRLLRP
ncbi:hypothetical protein DRN46_03695 [Thermococci archaeon]|nr:MAG: hypothetical protein DRN46_03695 [Thermococci archaeon]RLF96529.1 MAG: hypothetical protein DRN52_02245 [Thermococci archaeon]